uniref:Protein kinase domain-containing protein n=1 Tax=Ascaris lumbricoides TaxID=6252 RepID=A0A9J2PDW4_ASCLU
MAWISSRDSSSHVLKEFCSKTVKYVVDEKIGQGGYGAVYRVHADPSDGKEYAMKVEQKLERREHSKLNMEMHILKLMASQPVENSHFTKIIDRAKKDNFFLIVMTLVGESLADLKRERSPPVFSIRTGFGVAIQCLECIQELHKVGFIHRDIKPGNFAIGLPPKTHVIYILDFGIARKFTNENNVVKGPRCQVPFKGTVRYAALNCHRGKELGPKDDCESWLYMMVDCCNEHGLPWRQEKEKKKVELRKEEARSANGKQRLFKPMGVEDMGAMMDYIDKLEYQDKVDYDFLYGRIRKAAAAAKVNLDAPFDWEEDGTATEDRTSSGTSSGQTVPPRIKPKSKSKRKRSKS